MSLFDEMTKKKKQYDKEQKSLADSIVKGTYKQRDTKQVKQTSSPLLKGSDAKWYNENFNKREYQKYDLDTTLDNAPISKEAKDRIYSSYGIENDSSKSVAKKLSNIKNGDYTYYEGGKTGTKDGAISIKEANALRKYINEQNAKKQQEEINNRTVDDWKQLRDLSDVELKEQQRNTNQLLKDRGLNARVTGTKIQSDVAPSRNDVKVGDKFENNLQKDANNNIAVMDFIQTDEGRKQLKDLRQKWDERAYNISGYETKKAKEDEKNTSTLTKLATSAIRGGASVFNWTRGDLATENGQLSSYNEAFLNEQRENASNPLLKTAYGALSEIGKQTVVQALNSVLPGSGTAMYFGDIANDQYNNAINMGYSDKAAFNYALLSTGAEAAFEKILGAGSMYYNGKKGFLEAGVSKGLSKWIKNKTANDIASAFISEGTEEFLEEYLGEFNKQLTLDWADKDQNIDYSQIFSKETFNNAIESGIIGGITGAYGGTLQRIYTPKNETIVNQAIYEIERENGKISKTNQQMINNMAYMAEVNDTPMTSKQLVDNYKAIKEAQKNSFNDTALDLFPNLDEQNQKLYYDLINDVDKVIDEYGINIKFDPNLDIVSEYDGNTLVLNPTLTDTPIKTLVLKELGTELLDKKGKQAILSYVKENGLYDTLKQELLDRENYDETTVDNEIISRALNDILQDQEKLKQITSKNEGLLNELKDNINGLLAKFTNNRTTKDAQFLRTIGENINTLQLDKNNISGEELAQREIENIEKMEQEEQENVTQNQLEEVPAKSNAIKEQDVLGTKSRKAYKTMQKSDNLTKEEKEIAKLQEELDKYIPDSNEEQLQRADVKIKQTGLDEAYKGVKFALNTDKKINQDDIAILERVLEDRRANGTKEQKEEALMDVAMAGTIAGRSLQAMKLIYKMSPEGQANWIERTVNKMNKDIDKMNKHAKHHFEFTDEMRKRVENATEENLSEVVDEVCRELGEQVPMTLMEKIETWRYFAMLSAPTTHERNILGNIFMGKLQDIKNKIRGGIEDIYYKSTGKEGERTSTFKKAGKEYFEYAKNDIKNVEQQLGIGESKYINPKNKIQENQRMFKNNILEKYVKGGMIDRVSNLLEEEDAGTVKIKTLLPSKIYNALPKNIADKGIYIGGLQGAYTKAMAQYLYANKIDLKNVTDAQLKRARAFAIDQAKQATFHQDNAFATLLNQLENQNLATKLIVGGIIPFKKTPLNVAKTALEYNPVKLAKTLAIDSVKLYNGSITVNQYIDNISKGLTGTGIALLGYALAQMGIIRTTSDDDESYDEDKGIQPYSIVLGDKTISLDWLSPTAVPLFVGAELQHQFDIAFNNDDEVTKNEKIASLAGLLEASVSSLNPVSEMTMLSGVQNAIKSYSGDYAKAISQIGTNTIKSYASQFVPSILGKAARIGDEYERSTTSTKNGIVEKAIDQFITTTKSKIPGLRQTLPVKTDVWGNEVKQDSNVLVRAALNLGSPAIVKNVRQTELDDEIERVYKATGESSVLPKTYITKKFTYDNKDYQLSNQEYATYKKILGEENYTRLNNLIKNEEYKKLNDTQKAEIISKIFKFDNDSIKVAYAKANNIKYEDTSYQAPKKVESLGGSVNDYYLYQANLDEKDTSYEKKEKLKNFKISDTSKSAIYEASTSKSTNDLYQVLKESNVNINDYLDYLSKEFSADKKSDGTTIRGSKKYKLIDYMNNSNLTYEQKLLILGREFAPTTEQKNYIVNRINNSDLTEAQKLELYKSMSWIKVSNDGTVRW